MIGIFISLDTALGRQLNEYSKGGACIQGCLLVADSSAATTLAESVNSVIGQASGVVTAIKAAAASAEKTEHSSGSL